MAKIDAKRNEKKVRGKLLGFAPHCIYTLHAGSDSESGGDGGQYRDDDVDDFSPEILVHSYEL